MASILSSVATTAIQINNVTSAVSTISQLLTGGGPLVLGSFVFANYEVPSSISYGPKAETVSHLLPGGEKYIDSMASDYRDITWSGDFIGSNASTRAGTLQALVTKGGALPLTFSQSYFEVVVTDLSLNLLGPGRVNYSITCQVQANKASSSTSTSALSAIESDIGSALGIANLPSDLSSVTSALTTAQSVVGTLSTITGGSSAVTSLLSGLTAASSTITSVSSAANSALGTLSTLGSTLSGADAAISQINNITTQTLLLATAGQVGSYVSRAVTNIEGAIL